MSRNPDGETALADASYTYSLNPIDPARSGYLCRTCNNFDVHSFNRDPFGYRGYRYKAAQEAAAEGCSFCSLLVGCFDNKLDSAVDEFPAGWQNRWWIHLEVTPPARSSESGGDGLEIRWLGATLGPESITLPYPQLSYSDFKTVGGERVCRLKTVDFHVAADADSPAAINNDIQGRYLGENVLSYDYMFAINNWLKSCRSSHTKCCQTISGAQIINPTQAPLPTRCIEIFDGGYRLRETGSQAGSYLTLSHRWTPDTERCCTTTDNIRERRRGHTSWLTDLPMIFLDTLMVARRLGIRYVWIDSLCIIQRGDEGADWRREAVKMADYYQYALLTIAATSGSMDHGLIPPKMTLPPRLARLPYRDRNGARKGFFYVYSWNREVDQQYTTFVQESELLSRGWVFQEWLLSRRIVYFTPAGAFLECQERRPLNERFEVSEGLPAKVSTTNVQQVVKNSFLFDSDSINDLWYRLIEVYSALSLTKLEEDRLIALIGITKAFKEAMGRTSTTKGSTASTVRCGLEFVSGLWLRDLHWALLWEQKPTESQCRRLQQFPTWSWASISCPVAWNDDRHKIQVIPKAEMIAVVTPQGEAIPIDHLRRLDTFDIDNHIRLLDMRGRAPPVLLRERFIEERDLDIASAISGSPKPDRKTWRMICSCLRPTEVAGWASIEHPDYQNGSISTDGVELFAFHISTTRIAHNGYGLGYLTRRHNVFNVLFLKQLGQTYERVGVGKVFGKDIETQFHTEALRNIRLL